MRRIDVLNVLVEVLSHCTAKIEHATLTGVVIFYYLFVFVETAINN